MNFVFKYYKATNNYNEYSIEEFTALIKKLLPLGNTFKFTGGEPTLNSNLERDLAIVKKIGGITFLDTNGSSPRIISNLINKHLVDLFGISLKGLSNTEAMQRSGIKSESLCWTNVLESIDLISNRSDSDVIVTYVCYEDFELNTLDSFAKILSKYKNVYLKINNFQSNAEHATPSLKPKDPKELEALIKSYIQDHLEWENRVTLITGPKAVEQFSEVIIM